MLEGTGEMRLETQEVGLDMGFPPAPKLPKLPPGPGPSLNLPKPQFPQV